MRNSTNQLICSMTTYPGHMIRYGVCTNEPFQFDEIQNANNAIENSLYRRRSSTWPTVLVEDGIDTITNEVGMQEDIIVIKTEGNLDSDRFLMDSPLADCIISPDQSPGMETNEISQSQVNTIVYYLQVIYLFTVRNYLFIELWYTKFLVYNQEYSIYNKYIEFPNSYYITLAQTPNTFVRIRYTIYWE